MSASARLPGFPRPESQEVLLAAFGISLTGQGVPGPGGDAPLPVDVIARGGIGSAAAVEVGGPAEDAAQPNADPLAAGGRVPDEGFVPPEDWCWTDLREPGTGCPPELAGLTDEELQALTTPPPLAPAAWPDGIVPPDGFPNPVPPTLSGPGFGFGQGDPLDTAVPGPGLAALAEDASAVLAGIDDDCLTGVIRAWRRITSWATGRELAAVAELARRFPAEGLPGSGREYVADELAAALTLTGRTAQDERDLAWQLANVLPATLAALCAGLIDLAKARVIVNRSQDSRRGSMHPRSRS